MSETEDGLTDELLLEGFEHWATNEEAQRTKRVTPKGVLKLVELARKSLQLQAQLTEVTRERDELLRQRNNYPSDFDPSLRQHERDVTEIVELRAALAPLRAGPDVTGS